MSINPHNPRSLVFLDARYVRLNPTASQTITGQTLNIEVNTATDEALILKSLDDSIAKNLLEARDSSDNVFVKIWGDILGAGSIRRGLTIDTSTHSGRSIPLGVIWEDSNTSLTSNFSGVVLANNDTTINNYAAFSFVSDTSTGVNLSFGYVGSVFTDHTNGSVDADIVFGARSANVLGENFRVTGAGQVQATSRVASITPLVVKGASSQSANLQNWTDSSDNNLVEIDSAGNVGIGVNPTVAFDVAGTHLSGTGIARFKGDASFGFMALDSVTGGANTESGFLVKTGGTLIGQFGARGGDDLVYIKKRVFGTGDVMVFDSSGQVGIGESSPGAQLEIVVGSSARIGHIIKGASSQTANLQEWQNSSGTNLVEITAGGLVGIGATPLSNLDVFESGTNTPQIRIRDGDITLPNYSSLFNAPSLSGDEVGRFGSAQSTNGGFNFGGFTKVVNNGFPAIFDGYHGGTSPTTGAVTIRGFKHDGSTGRTALGATEIVLSVNATTNAPFLIKGAGNTEIALSSTTAVGLTVKGASSQTANLTEWQISDGTKKSWVTEIGSMNVNPTLTTPSDTELGIGLFVSTVLPTGTTTVTSGQWLFGGDFLMSGTVDFDVTGTGFIAGFQNAVSITVNSGKTIANLFAGRNAFNVFSTGTVTNGVRMELDDAFTGGGVVTNEYGLRIQDVNTGGTTNHAILTNAGNIVFNEGGDANTDFRVEGDTITDLLKTDAGLDRVEANGTFKTGQDRVISTETSTGTATMSDTVEEHRCNSASPYVLTLYTHLAGKKTTVINDGAGAVTLTPVSGTIFGESTFVLFTDESIVFGSNGTNYILRG